MHESPFVQDRKVTLKSRQRRLFFMRCFVPRAKIRQSVGIKMVVRLERSEPICLARFTGTISLTPFAKGQSKNNWKKIMVV